MPSARTLALSVGTDSLGFTDDERGPTVPGQRLHLDAVNHLDPDEQAAIRIVSRGDPSTNPAMGSEHPMGAGTASVR